jgi:hypothetical protein
MAAICALGAVVPPNQCMKLSWRGEQPVALAPAKRVARPSEAPIINNERRAVYGSEAGRLLGRSRLFVIYRGVCDRGS